MPEREAIDHAQRHSMPILPALDGERDPQWREVLRRLPTAWKRRARSRPRLRSARQPARDGDAQLEADALLAQRHAEVSPATAPFLMAALRGLDRPREPPRTRATPYVDAPGCVCGTPPVASIVRVGGAFQGYRHAMRAVRHRVAHAWYA
jgi:FdhE protein